MKKLIVVALVSLMSVSAFAGPYVQLNNKVKFTAFSGSTPHVSLSYENKTTYIEAGYKFKFSNGFSIKGKIASTNVDDWKHGFEAKIRYSF